MLSILKFGFRSPAIVIPRLFAVDAQEHLQIEYPDVAECRAK